MLTDQEIRTICTTKGLTYDPNPHKTNPSKPNRPLYWWNDKKVFYDVSGTKAYTLTKHKPGGAIKHSRTFTQIDINIITNATLKQRIQRAHLFGDAAIDVRDFTRAEFGLLVDEIKRQNP